MWIRKGQRDHLKGVDSPMPTQVVSNEEYVPRRQSDKQKEVEYWIGQIADEKSKKLGMDRRKFMASSMGLATCFLASNMVWGKAWDVDEAETMDEAAYEEKWPKSDYFIIDVQSHFTNGIAIGFRNLEFVKNMGFKLKEDPEAYSFPNFVKEMFFDSETDMLVISGVPGREEQHDKDGRVLEGKERTPNLIGGILPSWLMSQAREEINDARQFQTRHVPGQPRAQSLLGPRRQQARQKSHVRADGPRGQPIRHRLLEVVLPHRSRPLRQRLPARRRERRLVLRESRKRGLKIFSVHKGFSYQSRNLGHLANPKDVEKAALDHPDLTFVIYHSAIQHGPNEPTGSRPINSIPRLATSPGTTC